MKWTVEARIFNNGKIVALMREALEGEESYHTENEKYDLWIDVFETEQEARIFLREYKNG